MRNKVADDVDKNAEELSQAGNLDRKATKVEEAAELPTNFKEWAETQKTRGKRWMCLNTLKAAAPAMRI